MGGRESEHGYNMLVSPEWQVPANRQLDSLARWNGCRLECEPPCAERLVCHLRPNCLHYHAQRRLPDSPAKFAGWNLGMPVTAEAQ